MKNETELWSVRSIARFIDHSINYTRNVLVKQPGFPAPRHNKIDTTAVPLFLWAFPVFSVDPSHPG